MDNRAAVVNWDYSGKPDVLVGTGATWAEKALVWAAGLLAALVYVGLYLARTYDWPLWQYLLAAVMALDIGGGVVANSLNSGKRFYHTPARPDEPGYVRFMKNHLAFAALHVYPIVVGAIYGPGDWLYGLFWYGALLLSTVAVQLVPLYLRRPAAMFAVLLALLANAFLVAPVPGFAWLAPALFVKIVYGHGVREEPYRPATEG